MSKDKPVRAFPNPHSHGFSEGMTLHQWYAAHAPFTIQNAREFLFDSQPGFKPAWNDLIDALCRMQITYADKMMEKIDIQPE